MLTFKDFIIILLSIACTSLIFVATVIHLELQKALPDNYDPTVFKIDVQCIGDRLYLADTQEPLLVGFVPVSCTIQEFKD